MSHHHNFLCVSAPCSLYTATPTPTPSSSMNLWRSTIPWTFALLLNRPNPVSLPDACYRRPIVYCLWNSPFLPFTHLLSYFDGITIASPFSIPKLKCRRVGALLIWTWGSQLLPISHLVLSQFVNAPLHPRPHLRFYVSWFCSPNRLSQLATTQVERGLGNWFYFPLCCWGLRRKGDVRRERLATSRFVLSRFDGWATRGFSRAVELAFPIFPETLLEVSFGLVAGVGKKERVMSHLLFLLMITASGDAGVDRSLLGRRVDYRGDVFELNGCCTEHCAEACVCLWYGTNSDTTSWLRDRWWGFECCHLLFILLSWYWIDVYMHRLMCTCISSTPYAWWVFILHTHVESQHINLFLLESWV